MGLGNMFSWLRSQYDKLVAFAVLIGLIGSLVYLAVRIGMTSSEQKKFELWIQSLPIEYPDVVMTNTAAVDGAVTGSQNPFQVANDQWTNNLMFVPETRLKCLDCRRPIPLDAETCPFCRGKVPPWGAREKEKDSDDDGMPDFWEEKYKLDPIDASDGNKDPDGDGFTSELEFRAGTEPTDGKSHPSLESLLRIDDITEEPFRLKFKAVMTLPDGSFQFQINLREGERSYFVKMNEEVAKEGFKVVKYEPKFEMDESTGVGRRKKDVSVLTLQSGDELIPLIKGEERGYVQYKIKIVLDLDKSPYTVRKGEQLSVKWNEKKQTYTVIKIDTEDQSVVIRRAGDNKDFTVRKTLEFETK